MGVTLSDGAARPSEGISPKRDNVKVVADLNSLRRRGLA